MSKIQTAPALRPSLAAPRWLALCSLVLFAPAHPLLASTAPSSATTEVHAEADGASRDGGGPGRIAVRPAPQPPATSLAAWHSRYLPRAAPVKQALAKLYAARQEVDPTRYKQRYRDSCRLLDGALSRFAAAAREHDLYPEADAAARFHLRRAYAALGQAAAAGADGRYQAAEIALGESLGWFRQATVALERYGLEP